MGNLRAVLVAAGCASALCALPAGAQAQVVITPQTVTVRSGAVTAVINRAPVQVRFVDTNGRTVLSQVGARRGDYPFLAIDPQPLGSEYIPTPAHYASFQYEVGSEVRTQWPAGPWAGNLLFGKRSGRLHNARSVIAAEPDGNGVKLVLSTTERYRTLTVKIAPDAASPASMRIQAQANPTKGVIALGDSFIAAQNEQFYGFGSQHNKLSQRGRAFRSWTEAQNLSPGFFQGIADLLVPKIARTYQFPGGPNSTFYSQSLFVSSQGYGFAAHHNDVVRWRMAVDRSERWQVSASGGALDYTVAAGTGGQASSQLSAINGRHRLPPAWAMGPTLSRPIQTPTDTLPRYQRRVLEDVAQIEARNIPLTAYAFEEYRRLPASFNRPLIARLLARNIKPVGYYNSFIDPKDEPVVNGWVAKRKSGRPYVFTTPYIQALGLLDFTNPQAVAWWKGRIYAMLDDGIEGFMLDFGEQVLDDMYFSDGSTGKTMHQRYPQLMTKITREITDQYMAENPGREIFFFNRSGSSGRPGSAGYEEANFPGDETPDWSQASGLPSQTIDMLSRALGGAYGYAGGIGGYADFISPRTTQQLFTRWSQWAAFTPFYRLHNSSIKGVRMPWAWGDETYQAWLAAAKLHNRALPLIRQQWQAALAGGSPPIRPLWMAAPGEPGAVAEQQAWMIGNDLLAAPVVQRDTATKSVYLPAGCWKYGPDGTEYTGGQRVTVPAPITVLPYFTRCGTTPLAPAAP